MPTIDTAQALIVACVAILSGNAEIRTLCGRTTELVQPDHAQVLDGPAPILTYRPAVKRAAYSGTDVMQIEFAAYAIDREQASQLITIAIEALTNPAFALQGLDACPDPEALPEQTWDDAGGEDGDAMQEVAVVIMSFLVTPLTA